ncbi:CoA-transferase OS=Streptomyces microflavus OX=1919 GN=Smic_17370 PE=4 SV=1 [Streptomyces microflavus]
METPGGAHFTSCVPDHPRDEPFQKAYAAAAADPAASAEFECATSCLPDGDEKGYQQAVRTWHEEQK